VAPRKRFITRQALIEDIEACGSADADFFGYPKRDDGLFLQQDAEEYASFIEFMATKAPPAELALDIGIASGGQSKFLRDYWESRRTIFLDIGLHPDFPQWPRIRPQIDTQIELEIIDDSHAPRVRDLLLPYAGQVDFAFVDGDHSYRGLRKDIFLTKELLRKGGLMVLHDTTAAGDVNRVYQELLFSKDFVLVRNFANRFGISVWKLMQVKRMPNAFNRWSGLGRI
jgi:hypothetical protein